MTGSRPIEKTLTRKFGGREFNALSDAERTALWQEIVDASGRSNPEMLTKVIPRLKFAGRACLVLTVAVTAYVIWTSKNKVKAGMQQTIVLGSGALGGAAAGAAAGLVCGPAAVVCVTAGFIVGGIAGTLLGEAGSDALDPQLDEMSKWLGDVIDGTRGVAGSTSDAVSSSLQPQGEVESPDGGTSEPTGAIDDADIE